MAKLVRSLWIVWLLLAVLNLLFVNVYDNHLHILSDPIQTMGFWLISLILMLVVGIWWIGAGRSKGSRTLVALGGVCTCVFGLLMVGVAVYALAFGGTHLVTVAKMMAEAFGFISF